jgi:hypothetical protein
MNRFSVNAASAAPSVAISNQYKEDLAGGFKATLEKGNAEAFLQIVEKTLSAGQITKPGVFEKLNDLVSAYGKTIEKYFFAHSEKLDDLRGIAGGLDDIRKLANGVFDQKSGNSPILAEYQIINRIDYIHTLAEKMGIPLKPIDEEIERLRTRFSDRAVGCYIKDFDETAKGDFTFAQTPDVRLRQLELIGRAAAGCVKFSSLKLPAVEAPLNQARQHLARRACPYYLEELRKLSDESLAAGKENNENIEGQKIAITRIGQFSAMLSPSERQAINQRRDEIVRAQEERKILVLRG